MQITGEELFFLIQVLKDSLDIQMGYDWVFRRKLVERKKFYDKLVYSILIQEDVDIKELDLSKLKLRDIT